jgi:hypothetical protein
VIAAEQLVAELIALRRGRGLQTAQLADRLGPGLRTVCDVCGGTDREARQQVWREIERLSADFPADLRTAIRYALAVVSDARHAKLGARIDALAVVLRCGPRTARRRVDEAFTRLAFEAARRRPDDTRPADPERGWQVSRFKALLRLDTPTPELVEERTIVAVRDALDRIAVRFSLPPPLNHRAPAPAEPASVPEIDVGVDVQQGAMLESRERQGSGHFRFVFALPRTLRRGEQHTYTVVLRIPPGQPVRNHYAFVPLVACDTCELRVRFDARRPPAAVWRLAGLAPRMLDEQPPPGEPLRLDLAAEVALDFDDLRQGFAYGFAWTPAASERSNRPPQPPPGNRQNG